MAALVGAAKWRSSASAVAAGALFGAAALTREIALPVSVAGIAWCVLAAEPRERVRAVRNGAIVLGCALLVVAPWAARNYAIFERILPISSVGWIAIGEGNALEGAQWLRPSAPGRSDFRREVLAIEDEGARIEFARKRTLAMIAAEQPGWIFEKIAHNVPLMLSPDAFQLYKLRHRSYGEVSPAIERAVVGVTVLAYGFVMVLAAVGIAAASAGRRRSFALLVTAAVIAVHVFANANSRFRMPWMPLLMVYAAYAANGGRTLAASLGPAARFGVTAFALLVGGVYVSFFAS
jgi:hypothetical protein